MYLRKGEKTVCRYWLAPVSLAYTEIKIVASVAAGNNNAIWVWPGRDRDYGLMAMVFSDVIRRTIRSRER